MVETRSGRSVEPGDSPRGGSPERPARKDTATTGGQGAGTPRRRRPGGAARGEAAEPSGSTQLTTSQSYTLLALELLVFALPCIFSPKLAARAAFGSAANPPEDQHTHVLGLLASGLLAASAAAFALEECARRGQAYLLTFTADTLKLGLVAFAAMNIVLQFYYPRTLTAAAAIASSVAMCLLAALPASQLLVAPEDRARVWNDFRRLPGDLLSGTWLRRSSLPGALYMLLTIAFPAAGLAYFVAPNTTLYHTFGYIYGKSTAMVWKGIGAGLVTILPAITYTLKDKAENELLGRSIARTLNLGLMAASIGHLLVLGTVLNHGIGGFMLPAVTATWGTALLASMAGLAAPEVAAIAEQTAEAARSMD
ncbi:hypothetical protein COHA_008138 [Chlorella ohadii]|uniref:Uncharacterized protein n=1 Tax=Chlorella ohadii TaxID=2649997 RepID=A0AAD5H2R7_9CHLO|nr:hypothetical protein COHA_008138 [Chlorella ohadii]